MSDLNERAGRHRRDREQVEQLAELTARARRVRAGGQPDGGADDGVVDGRDPDLAVLVGVDETADEERRAS